MFSSTELSKCLLHCTLSMYNIPVHTFTYLYIGIMVQVNGGSVQLFYDEAYGGFVSAEVLAEKGTHEGQLCYKYSDGYEDMYPVKPFEIKFNNDLVGLYLDTSKRKELGRSYSGSSAHPRCIYSVCLCIDQVVVFVFTLNSLLCLCLC